MKIVTEIQTYSSSYKIELRQASQQRVKQWLLLGGDNHQPEYQLKSTHPSSRNKNSNHLCPNNHCLQLLHWHSNGNHINT